MLNNDYEAFTFIHGSSDHSYTLLSTYVQPVISAVRNNSEVLLSYSIPSPGRFDLVLSLSTTNVSTPAYSVSYSVTSQTNVSSITYTEDHGLSGIFNQELVYGSRVYHVDMTDAGLVTIRLRIIDTGGSIKATSPYLVVNASIFSII